MSGSPALPRVVAVVVSYNRERLLAEALDALAAQTLVPAVVIVVDNGSTDGSVGVATEHPIGTDVVALEANTGGAGGFAAGVLRAIVRHDPDWLWLMDDDTVPTPEALERLVAAASADREVVLAGSRVVWTDGRDHPMNTPRPNPFASRKVRGRAAAAGVVPIRSSSFVSMLVRSDVVLERGLPVADFFIWNDDFEFSTRMLRGRLGIHVPDSVVVHKTRVLGSTDADPGERFYYEVRNKIWIWRFSLGLSFFEKLVYGAATARRWARTIRRSSDKKLLRDCRKRGIRDGRSTGPRPTLAVLAALPQLAPDVALLTDGEVEY